MNLECIFSKFLSNGIRVSLFIHRFIGRLLFHQSFLLVVDLSRESQPWISAVDLSRGPQPWASAVGLSRGPQPWTSAVDFSRGLQLCT